MSANGGGEMDASFSPNIKSETEQSPNIETGANEKTPNSTEKITIDGIPIADEDIEFRAKDIHKKDDGDLFVNVEGAEKIAKEAERKKRLEEERLKKEAAEKERAEQEEEKRQERAILEEAKRQERAEKAHERKVKQQERQKKRHERRKKRLNFLFGGKRKFVTVGIILIVVCTVGGILLHQNVFEPARIAHIQATTEQNAYVGTEEAQDIEAVIQKASDMALEGKSVDERLSYIKGEIDSSRSAERKALLESLYWRTYGYEVNQDKAIEELEKIEKQTDKSYIKADVFDSIALIYRQKGDETKCLEYQNKAKEYK